MKLLVDAGNSCLKWAWLDDALTTGGRVLRGKKTAKAVLSEAWDECDTVPDAVLVSNVAGESFRRSLTTYIKKRWSIKPEYLAAEAEQCDVKNGYDKPETLGVDRWLAMLGARSIKSTPLCVIDCGTALTIDVVDKQGQHMGGLIMPGMHLMRQSLIDAASDIKTQPNLSADRPQSFLAADTDNAIIVGTLYTAIAAIDRIVNDVRAELGNALQCYITGGEAALFLPLIEQRFRHEPELVFKGMQAILQQGESSVEKQPGKKKKTSRKKAARKSRAKKADQPSEQVSTEDLPSDSARPDAETEPTPNEATQNQQEADAGVKDEAREEQPL